MLNLAWMGFWFALIVAIAFFVDPFSVIVFSYIAIFLGIYFSNILYPIFMKEQKFTALKEALKLGVQKAHMFILPYFLISLVMYLFIKATSLMAFQYASYISTIILLAYVAVVRYYVSGLAFELRK